MSTTSTQPLAPHDRLRLLRERLRKTQSWMAGALQLSLRGYQNYEAGKRPISQATAERMGINPDWLFHGNGEMFRRGVEAERIRKTLGLDVKDYYGTNTTSSTQEVRTQSAALATQAMDRVTTALTDLQLTQQMTLDQVKVLVRYAIEHDATIEQLRDYIVSAYQVAGKSLSDADSEEDDGADESDGPKMP